MLDLIAPECTYFTSERLYARCRTQEQDNEWATGKNTASGTTAQAEMTSESMVWANANEVGATAEPCDENEVRMKSPSPANRSFLSLNVKS